MIEVLEKINLDLQIDYLDYLEYLYDEIGSEGTWFGVSIQIIDAKYSRDIYQKLNNIFGNLVKNNNKLGKWFILHDDKILPWFYDNALAVSFPLITNILRDNNMNINDKGVITCDEKDLLKISEELIAYPSVLKYKNIDCINSESRLIIKITSHMTIDLISDDYDILTLNTENLIKNKDFVIKKYNRNH